MEPVTSRYANAPMMAYWEMTRACDLSCRHCRAESVAWRHPFELSTQEGFRLLEQLASFTPKPHLVLTGGDPLKRPDVFWMIDRAVQLGLTVSITPAGTPLLTQGTVAQMKTAGVHSVALSLDGSTAQRHDAIRMVPGSFAHTVRAAGWVREAGLGLQVNSLVCAETVRDLADVHELVTRLDADRWSVFFLVTVGRGAVLSQLDSFEAEAVLEWLYDLAQEAPRPVIKTTEAHHYRRIAMQRRKVDSRAAAGSAGLRAAPASAGSAAAASSPAGHGASGAYAGALRGMGIRDGAGVMFISHTGEVYPSGFLPVSAGNVRLEDPVRIYRESPLFVQLRDTSQLKGKCGACEYKQVCGGARSRAWAATGDVLAPDPLCVYQPRGYAPAQVAAS